MSIPSVVGRFVETEDRKVFELDSPKGSVWLESVTSFRYEPIGSNKNYTARKEAGKGGYYWYGYRTVEKKVHKRYIGKSSDLTIAKLEEIAEALNTPPTPRTKSKNTDIITEKLVCNSNNDELTALKQQMQVMQEALEALQEVVLSKSQRSDTPETRKPSSENTEQGLHIAVGTLKAENEALRQELEAAQAANKRWEDAFGELEGERDDLESEVQELRSQLETVQTELEACRQQPATEFDLSGKAGEVMNFFKTLLPKGAKLPSSTISRVEEILEG